MLSWGELREALDECGCDYRDDGMDFCSVTDQQGECTLALSSFVFALLVSFPWTFLGSSINTLSASWLFRLLDR